MPRGGPAPPARNVPPPPPGTAGTSLDTEFTLSACDGWGDPALIASFTFTAVPPAPLAPVVVAAGPACAATAQLPAGQPVPVRACARDVHGGETCSNVSVAVAAAALTAAQLHAKMDALAGLRGAAAQAGAAMVLLQAIGAPADAGERARLKDRLMAVLQELGTCGAGLRAAADVQVCAAGGRARPCGWAGDGDVRRAARARDVGRGGGMGDCRGPTAA